MLTEGQILSGAMEFEERKSAVYFLIKDQKIVYVGKSTDIRQRLRNWRSQKIDSYYMIPCPVADLERLERSYIEKFDPPLNNDALTRTFRGIHHFACKTNRKATTVPGVTRRIITPDGEFYSIQNAADNYGISRQAAWQKATNQVAGWRFPDAPLAAKRRPGRPRKSSQTTLTKNVLTNSEG